MEPMEGRDGEELPRDRPVTFTRIPGDGVHKNARACPQGTLRYVIQS